VNRILARRLRTTALYVAMGVTAGALIGVIISPIDRVPALGAAARGVVIGAWVGLAVGLTEELLVVPASRRMRLAGLNVIRLTTYFAAIQGGLVAVNTRRFVLVGVSGWVEGAGRYLGSASFPRDLALAALATLVLTALMQVKRLHHASEIWKLVTGRYHYPEQEERVFLFVDLVGSTHIAETLGDVGFSTLLRDMFAEISEAILAWGGKVYQHVGDGVIVTWSHEGGLRGGAGVRCFFEMRDQLRAARTRFEQLHGVVPRLTAAVHVGPVVTTWVGEARKELAFHGDTLNVTARIQATCRTLGVECLVSEALRETLRDAPELSFRPMGEVELRGKSKPMRLFAAEPSTP
jgi:adenylate cyclase